MPEVGLIAAADPGSALPEGWHKGGFMQIFVRSYQDSDGDGRGDLRGLIQRLDYLQALGVRGLWLMPITRSQDGDHGYAVTDYRNVETAYGNLADVDELLRQAHARGIGVILDYVLNHSAAQHPLFLNSRDAATNPYRDWYVWQPTVPAGWSIYGANPWHATSNGAYFAGFWDQMPDFNLLNAAVVEFHKSNLRFWLNRGIDGFRFDAVGNLVENGPNAWENQPRNYTLMREMQELLAGYRNRYMVCEAPADPAGFGAATACGSAFAFGLQGRILAATSGDASAVRQVGEYFNTANPALATMLSNHDSFAGARPWDQLGGNEARLRLAAASYLLLPGSPFIYYGEEIGMAGAATLSGDAALRTPMSWDASAPAAGFSSATPYRALSANAASRHVAAQQADPGSLLNHYKALLALRNRYPALRQGGYAGAVANGALLSFRRKLGAEELLVLINYGGTAVNAAPGGLSAGATLSNVFPAGAADASADAAGTASVALPAQSLRVFLLR